MTLYLIVLGLFHLCVSCSVFVFNSYYGGYILFCNVCVCVCVCVGFVKCVCVCVCMCGFCNVWVL